jgi:nicotinamide-nucleotide amidase
MNSIEKRAAAVLQKAIASGLSLVTAESCTAGALAKAFAQAEGASKYFHGGIVAYTKPMKIKTLGVSPELLEEKSAVCAEVAVAMAEGALARSPADIAVSITGVAGPEPDEDGNPVGLVYCAVAQRRGLTQHRRLDSGSDIPGKVLDEAMELALRLVEEACLASDCPSLAQPNL